MSNVSDNVLNIIYLFFYLVLFFSIKFSSEQSFTTQLTNFFHCVFGIFLNSSSVCNINHMLYQIKTSLILAVLRVSQTCLIIEDLCKHLFIYVFIYVFEKILTFFPHYPKPCRQKAKFQEHDILTRVSKSSQDISVQQSERLFEF